MKFYWVVFLIAFLQSSVMVPLMGSYLYVPDFVLVVLYTHTVFLERVEYRKGIMSGLFLDILQDSLGWHIAGKTFFLMMIDVVKSRVFLLDRYTFILVYLMMSLMEHFLRLSLFRIKYYYPLSLSRIALQIGLEMLFLLYTYRYISYRGET
ncbi:hypothetical protein Thal_1372 [Thermocrinis albus DSM 14484]|uniref:Rod shape-determining protein MreD n=1 Tax=Thermocrinis albus (strain DSM 14484 / JCM 11386 / HI 11/12) TaxID=638303 RepID=D3SMM3_THEAH|nr:hypothetical protein [Thermocrinis albus]ADC90003.1 hypothetical protein Thal_1372 [Thermocrinis albus DSM 14484]